MEFRHMSVTAFFNLTIGPFAPRVEIYGLSFDGHGQDPIEITQRLISAIADARRPSSNTDLSGSPECSTN
jgi:hypothetical protein